MSHVNIHDIDLNELKLAKVGKVVKLLYKKEPLQLVTSKMYAPFGVKVQNNDYSSYTKCHLDCSLNQNNSTVSVKYREALEALDQKIAELIKEHVHLFNIKETIDYDNYYTPVLKENKSYPKLMKITLPRDRNGNFDFVVFNENKEKMPLDDNNIEQTLSKGKIFKGIVEFSKVWFFKGKFGVMMNLVQMKFIERETATEDPTEVENTSSKNIYNNNLMLDD